MFSWRFFWLLLGYTSHVTIQNNLTIRVQAQVFCEQSQQGVAELTIAH